MVGLLEVRACDGTLRTSGLIYQVYEDVHHSPKVSDDRRGREEQAVRHDLEVQLQAHEDHKHVLSDLKHSSNSIILPYNMDRFLDAFIGMQSLQPLMHSYSV